MKQLKYMLLCLVAALSIGALSCSEEAENPPLFPDAKVADGEVDKGSTPDGGTGG